MIRRLSIYLTKNRYNNGKRTNREWSEKMYHYSVEELDKNRMYKMISGSIIPRAIGWITTLNEESEVVNAAPFSFTSGVSNEVPLISMAILRKNGEPKDSARNLLAYKNGVVHIVSSDIVDDMNETAADLKESESEIDRTNLHLIPSKTVKTPGIKEAKIRMEVKLYDYHPVKDREGNIVTDFFFLEVTDFHFDESIFDVEREYISVQELKPVARLAGPYYATLDEIYRKDRPK